MEAYKKYINIIRSVERNVDIILYMKKPEQFARMYELNVTT